MPSPMQQKLAISQARLAAIQKLAREPDLPSKDKAFLNNLSKSQQAAVILGQKALEHEQSQQQESQSPELTEEQKAEAEKRAAPIIESIKKLVLMELTTPFNKPLGDLNEAEGCKLTGWQATVFTGIGKQKLRDARTEADLHAAFARVNC